MRCLIGLPWALPLLLAGACARPGLDSEPLETERPDDAADAGPPDDDQADDGDQGEDAEPADEDDDDDGVDEGIGGEADAGRSELDAGTREEDAQSAPSPGCDDAELLSTELAVGAERVSAIRINGSPGTQADVAPGASVRLEFDVNFASCEMLVGPPKQVYLGFEVASMECRSALCSRFNPSSSFEFTLQAPSEPGLHYVSISIAEQLLCAEAGNADTHLAALCVLP